MPSLLPGAPAGTNRWRRRLLLLAAGVLLVLALLWLWGQRFGQPDDYDHMEAQFKYGSIGADHPMAQAPLPYWLWKALPEVFPTVGTLPPPQGPNNDRKGYEAFGLVVEPQAALPRDHVAGQPAFERPIGFSKRRVLGMDFVGLNCAFCHLGSFKSAADAPRQVVLGGTGNAVDIEQYFLYLFASMTDPRFKADAVMPAVERELQRQGGTLPWWQRFVYRHVLIPVLPTYLSWMQRSKFDFIYPANPQRLPEFGPGRVDTWDLYKRVFVDPPQHDSISGTSDFPSLWNQKAREGMRMHWDGNTDVLIERNIVSALSLVGSRIDYLDYDRLTRVTDWIVGLLPPRYVDRYPAAPGAPPAVDTALSLRGQAVFNEQCAQCHAPQSDRIGRVEPIADLGTDPERIAEFTPELMQALNRLGTRQWQLRHFRVENGYVNMPLDGIWLRAPYLHNGSVPTLRDLLQPPPQRPVVFCRGGEVVDWQNLGYLTPAPVGDSATACGSLFRYDTRVRGNGNGGHLYGTSLGEADKRALLEFLKTL